METFSMIEKIDPLAKILNSQFDSQPRGCNYQLTIFVNDENINFNITNNLLEKIIQQNPTTLMNFEKARDCLNLLARSSSIYVFVQNQFSFESMSNTLDYLNACPKIRPRCLLVLLSEIQTSIEERLMEFLSYVWSLKFLDFTTLNFNENNPKIYNYIPFNNSYSRENFSIFSKIFPDKLRNMYGYPLKIPLYPLLPSVIISEIQDNYNTTKVTGSTYLYLEIFSKQLNFTLDKWFIYNDYNRSVHRQELFEKLERNEASILPATYLMRTDYSGRNLSVSRPQDYDSYAMLVPVLPESKLNFSYDVVAYISLFPMIIVLYMILVRVFKFPQNAGKFINILKVLLGWHLPVDPNQWHQRIVYLSLMFLTIQYTSIAFSKLLDVKIVQQEKSFDTLEQVLTSDLNIYAAPYINNTLQIYSNDDSEIAEFKSRIQFINIIHCFDKILNEKNCICLTPYNFLMSYMKRHSQAFSRKLVKVANLKLLHDYNAFALERASPYVEKFDEIMQRIIEFGKPKVWIYSNTTIEHENEGIQDNLIFLLELAVIMIVGLSAALLMFVYECISARFSN